MGRGRQEPGTPGAKPEEAKWLSLRDSVLVDPPMGRDVPPWSSPFTEKGAGRPGAYEDYRDPSRTPYKVLRRGESPGPHKHFVGAREIPVDTWAHVQVFDGTPGGKEFDISDDIVGVSYTRNMGAPSRLSITLANEGDKYRSLFIPKNRIRVWGKRDERVMCVFTGYARRNPYFSVISQREITLECDDLIGTLVDKEWDPNLPENINAVSSYLPQSQAGRFEGSEGSGPTGSDPNAPEGSETPGAIEGAEEASPEAGIVDEAESILRGTRPFDFPAPRPALSNSSDAESVLEEPPTEEPTGEEGEEEPEGGEETPEEEVDGPDGESLQQAVWPDETLAYLLTAPEHLNLDPKLIWIQEFPETWKRRAAEIDAQVDYCQTSYKDLIICPEEGLSNPCETEGGGSGGGVGPGPDSESKRDIARYIAAEAVKRDFPPELPVITALVETEMNPNLGEGQSDRDSAGLYQQRAPYGSEKDRMDVAISTKWFLDEAENFRTPVGADDADAIGLWAANTQRPQEDLRYKYATRFAEARQLIGDSAESYEANYSPNTYADNATFDNVFDNVPAESGEDAPPGEDIEGSEEGSEPPAAERPDGSFEPEEAPCGSGSAGGGGGGGTTTGGSLNVKGGEICCDYMAGCSIAQQPHAGADVCAPTGSEIGAWGDGVVIHSQVASGYATTTIVDFGGEYVLFGHLLSGSTKPTGTSFSGGDVIGKVGTSQDAMGTTPHAHIQAFTSKDAALGYNNSAVKDPKQVYEKVSGSSARAVFVPVTDPQRSELVGPEGSSATRIERRLTEEVMALGAFDPEDTMTADDHAAECMHCGNPEPASLLFGMQTVFGEEFEVGTDESGTGNPPNGYSHVSEKRELIYSLDTRYATFFEAAAQKWDALGGVKLRKGSGSEVTCRVADTSLGTGTMGRTYSDGRLYFNPSEMDDATDNAKLSCALHELGHALGYPHATPRSVLNTPITKNSNSNPDAPTDYDKKLHAETWGDEGGGGGEENLVLKEFLTKCLECVGAPYRWGGGHGEVMKSTAEIKSKGVDCSGFLSQIRILMDLKPGDVGATTQYESFLVNTSEFDPTKKYPVGTVFNNPGGGDVIGHIAMVSDEQGHIVEANGGAGRVINTNTIASGNEGWAGFTTAGEFSDVGTADAVGTGGTGEGPHTDDGDSEPCIMKNPLGPYKLAFTAAGMNDSTWLRSAALNNGNFNATQDAQRSTAETSMDYNGHLFDNAPEDRDWTELGRMLYEPYLPTVQGIAASGMYQFMTVGTGEIVFWYPHFIIEREAYFLLPDAFEERDEAERRDYWRRMSREEKAKLYGALSEERFTEVFGWVSEEAKALLEAELEEKPYLASTGEPGTMAARNSEAASGYVSGDTRNVEFLETPIIIEDIELKDFHLEISDEELVTHYYVLGDFRLEGEVYGPMALETMCSRWATVKYHPFLKYLAEERKFDWEAFLDLYGSRTLYETVPSLKTPGLAQLYADNEFLRRWLQNYTVSIDIAFMPEIYPGMKLEIESLGIQVSVLQVSGTMGDSWTTSVVCSMPLQVKDSEKIPPIPFWALGSPEGITVGQEQDTDSPNSAPGLDPTGASPPLAPGGIPPSTGPDGVGEEGRELDRITDDILRELDERESERTRGFFEGFLDDYDVPGLSGGRN